MNGWQADLMAATAAAEEWERLNEPDELEEKLKEAARELERVNSELIYAEDKIYQAAQALSGTPMETRILSYFDQMTEIRKDIGKLKDRFERGERV